MPGPQSQFVMSEARYPAMFSGRAGGKTVASIIKAFKLCIDYPGIAGCLTEPTIKMVKRTLIPAMRRVWGPLEGRIADGALWEWRKADMEIGFSNGSVIYLGYADDPESVRGLDISFFGMDEARVGSQYETFLNLVPATRQPGYPHQGWVTTTPAGRNHWLYWYWVQGQLPSGEPVDMTEHVMIEAHTEDNTHLTPEDLRSWQNTFGPTKFAEQELFGKFVVFEGQAFPEFGDAHVRTLPSNVKVRRRVLGFDWGDYSPTAVVELQQDEANNIWVTDLFYKRRCGMDELVEAISEMNAAGNVPMFCDPNTKDEIDFLRKAGIPARKAKSNSFQMRYQLVQRRIADRTLYVDPSCVDLITELQGLEFAESRQGEYGRNWKGGCPDHAYDALAYALMHIDEGARGRPQPPVFYRRWGH